MVAGRALTLFVLGVLALHTCPAGAATFTVTPVRVFLSAKTRTAMLTLTNTSGEILRVQLEAFAWDEDRQGRMQLQPTSEVVFFPKLLSVAPGEQRHVRIGLKTGPAAVEKTFRIFIDELPLKDPASAHADGVRFLTRLGIPIFLVPPTTVQAGQVEGLALRGGTLAFAVTNSGTVHLLPTAIVAKGRGQAGEMVAQWRVRPWYVLAGGTRLYEVAVAPEDCARLAEIVVEVETDRRTISERTRTSGNECR